MGFISLISRFEGSEEFSNVKEENSNRSFAVPFCFVTEPLKDSVFDFDHGLKEFSFS